MPRFQLRQLFMYTLSLPGDAVELTALIEVFQQLFRHDARLSAHATIDVRLLRDGVELNVTRYNGVRDTVLADYHERANPFRFDLQWAEALLECLALRGSMAVKKLRTLTSVSHLGKSLPSAESVDGVIAALEAVPDDATFAKVDDALFCGRTAWSVTVAGVVREAR
ncbi:hypothetical protein P3T43_006249 [Paraburkholderia sp. GAS41]|uniref:hypothetical protein n=1 Tax=Paraburkholderia sp. GAS41 TaxID=3035134 RepID=UPI003D1E5F26